jgi:hypothetical protein
MTKDEWRRGKTERAPLFSATVYAEENSIVLEPSPAADAVDPPVTK